MGAILSFLGGGTFRAIWGEFSSWLNARQEHKHELERMALQGKLEAEQHARNLEAQKLQAELGFKTIAVQADADMGRVSMQAWADAAASAQKPTGITFVDLWNGVMRPAFYTLALAVVLLVCCYAHWSVPELQAAGIVDLVYSIIGFLFVDRTMGKRGK